MVISEQSKDRKRTVILFRSFLLMLLALSCGRRAPSNGAADSEQGARSGDAIRVDAVAVLVDQPRTYRYSVRKGDTFSDILDIFGVGRAESLVWYRELKKFGMAALFPGDSMILGMAPDGTVRTLSLLSRRECWFHAVAGAEGYAVTKVPLAVSVHRCLVKGSLVSSLSESMFALGEGDGLVAQLADIFAWDINFFTDPREGDTFEVLFEKNYTEGVFSGYGAILAARYCNAGTDHYALGMRDSTGTMQYYNREGKSVQKQFLKAPLRFNRISSGYSFARRHPVTGIVRPHLGIDYAAPTGTPVHAAADGVVRFAGTRGGFGRFIQIAHGASYVTSYGHLSAFASGIRSGVHVVQGQCIGRVGMTGVATGPHLDYRMQIGNRFVDPRKVNLPSKEGVTLSQREQFDFLSASEMLLFTSRFPELSGSWVLEVFGAAGIENAPAVFVASAQRADENDITSGT